MAELVKIIKNRVVDVYDGDNTTAAALEAHGADQVTLYTRERCKNIQDYSIVTRPYGAALEAADCVADVCLLDNKAIKVLVAMYPSAPKYVLLRFAPRWAWLLGSIGLIRRLVLGLVRIDGIVTLTDADGRKERWLALQQRGISSHNKSPVLPARIGVPKFLAWLRAENINYVVLRFYEKLPALYRKAGDIDILLTNEDKELVKSYLEENEHLLEGVSKDIRLGLHAASGEEGSIPYYSPSLARQILECAIDGPAGSRIPSPKDALRSFVYHALYHAKKGYAAGIPSAFKKQTEKHPENDYIGVIQEMANVIGVSPGKTMEELDDFLAAEGWRPKLDTLAKLAETNAWVYDRFFALGQGGPVGLAVFVLREWVYERGLADQAVSVILENDFKIIRKKVLSDDEKKFASETLRGGSWGQNSDGTTTGWLPAVVLVVVDMKCVKMPPAYAKGYEHYKIRTLKNALRATFDMEDIGSVHSTDNSHESWEYIDVCFPGEVEAVRHEFESLAQVSIFAKLAQFLSPTYLKHSLRYSVREYVIRRFLS
jgi:hypothetical protein